MKFFGKDLNQVDIKGTLENARVENNGEEIEKRVEERVEERVEGRVEDGVENAGDKNTGEEVREKEE